MPGTRLYPHFSNYDSRTPFPSFQQPHMFDGFSLEQDRAFVNSRKYLKFLRLPEEPFSFDLSLGYNSYIPGPKEVNITSLLQFIGTKKNHLVTKGKGNKLNAHFVCYRGLLTQLFITPYFPRDPWTILATRYKGTIYLCNYNSPEKVRAEQERATEYSNRCCYYGKNFERFILTDDPAKDCLIPADDDPLNDVEEFNVVLTTKIDNWRVLYSAEVDGVDDSQEPATIQSKNSHPLEQFKFVEVKTRMQDTTESQRRNYLKWKLPKWWCQSFLVGVDTIFVGFRSKDGVVEKMEKLPVREIPRMCRDVWSPSVMVRFGSDFFSTAQELMQDVDCPLTVFKFTYDSKSRRNVTYEVLPGRSTFSFLPQTYVDAMTGE